MSIRKAHTVRIVVVGAAIIGLSLAFIERVNRGVKQSFNDPLNMKGAEEGGIVTVSEPHYG